MIPSTRAAAARSTAISSATVGGWAAESSFAYQQPLSWDALIGRARSASYLPREGPAYDEMAEKLRALYDQHADGTVRFALVTTVHLGERMS